MTLILRDPDVEQVLSMPAAVDAIREGVVGTLGTNGSAPAVTARSIARFDAGWLRIMSGTLPAIDAFGFKAFHLVGDTIRYVCMLYRLGTGEPLAVLDANHLTVVRTSATAAVAARHFWGERGISVAVIGSGVQARSGLLALAAACDLTSVTVHSPRRRSREDFAASMSDAIGVAVAPRDTPHEACVGVDMVLCATHTEGHVALRARDVDSVRYISSISSTLPVQRELDEQLISRADRVVVDTWDALEESGDLLAAAKMPGWDQKRAITLAEYLCRPPDQSQSTVFKSIGSVEQDLSVAYAGWQAALGRGLGDEVPAIECVRPL